MVGVRACARCQSFAGPLNLSHYILLNKQINTRKRSNGVGLTPIVRSTAWPRHSSLTARPGGGVGQKSPRFGGRVYPRTFCREISRRYGAISQFFGLRTQKRSLAVDRSLAHMPERKGRLRSTRMASTVQPGRRDLKQCPRCGTTMLIQHMIAKFGPLPETRRYRCPNCRCVIEEEVDRNGHPLSAIKFVGSAEWLGTRRVVH
jgi:hypothetical protein